MLDPDRLDVFYGELTPASADVYVRLEGIDKGTSWSLAGSVSGPYSAYARTLPSTSRLISLGPGDTLLARATVPDPCSWSPLAPCHYRVDVELREGTRVVATAMRQLGFRRLGVVGRDLRLDARRWVLRGVDCRSTGSADLNEWRTAEASLVAPVVDEKLAVETSRNGTVVVAANCLTSADVEVQLRALSQWPSIAVAILKGETGGPRLQQAAPNILRAQAFEADEPIQVAAWADLAICSVEDVREFAARIQGLRLPVIARRALEAPLRLEDARAACDLLQRDLARYCDLAGYIV